MKKTKDMRSRRIQLAVAVAGESLLKLRKMLTILSRHINI